MIPSGNISTTIYAKIIGDQAYLEIAQRNLFANLELITRSKRMHTFFEFNGQMDNGVNCNTGDKRYYTWKDTIINCRYAPNLVNYEGLGLWGEAIADNKRFIKIKTQLEEGMEYNITIDPFYKVLYGKDNMRYNICLDSKIEDFDSIRIGVCLKAENKEVFKKGLMALKEHEKTSLFT